MRILPLFALLPALALPVWAEEFVAPADVVAVTLYPQGAQVTRRLTLDLPAGTHDLIVTGLPLGLDVDSLRVTGVGLFSIGASEYRDTRLPPADPAPSPERERLEDLIAQIEDQIEDQRREIAAVFNRVVVADLQMEFLRSMAGAKADERLDDVSIGALGQLTELLGTQAAQALADAHAARGVIAGQEQIVAELTEDLARARKQLTALDLPPDESARLRVALAAAEDTPAQVDITYVIYDAGWAPVYDLWLAEGDMPALDISRNARVWQDSGEPWVNVALTLSTARPDARAEPSNLPALQARFRPPYEIPAPAPMAAARLGAAESMMEADAFMAMPAPAAEPFVVEAQMMGQTVVYRLPDTVSLPGDHAELQLVIAQGRLPVELSALAVPLLDSTAFLIAGLTNDSAQVILPGTATLYRDGAMIGRTSLPLIAAGGQYDQAFGAIDGLVLTRNVLARADGSTGFITTSNRRQEDYRIVIENQTDRAYPLRVLDRAPFTEQDDLRIEVTTTPAPDQSDVDGRRGVMAWDLVLEAGAQAEILLSYTLQFPQGMELDLFGR